jgi:hypothetical protein
MNQCNDPDHGAINAERAESRGLRKAWVALDDKRQDLEKQLSTITEHLRVTTLLLRETQRRESSLIVKVNKLLRLIDAALTQYDLGGELEPETRHDLALAVDGRER